MTSGSKWAVRAFVFLLEIYVIDAAVSFFQGYKQGRDEEVERLTPRRNHVERRS